MTVIDWMRYRKCPVCGAGTGDGCVSMASAHRIEGRPGAVRLTTRPAGKPHGGRQLRTGAVG